MGYATIAMRHTGIRELEPEAHFLLELDQFMNDLRQRVNELRLKPALLQYQMPHLQYLTGRIHGLVFGMARMFIYRGTHDSYRLEYARESAMNEANFLTSEYLHGSAA